MEPVISKPSGAGEPSVRILKAGRLQRVMWLGVGLLTTAAAAALALPTSVAALPAED